MSNTDKKNQLASAADKEKTDEKTGKKRIVVSFIGGNCATCARVIEKQLEKVEGVSDVKTAIMLNKVFIDFDPSLVDSTVIRKAVDKTGYKSYMTEEKR